MSDLLVAEFIKGVSDYGIQATMLIWFMFRTEKVIERNTQAMNGFGVVIQGCKKHGK